MTNQTINPLPGSPLPGNVRRSKIGRLPTHIRHWLNQRLRECVPYETISEQLTKLGCPGITVSNISTWSTGGHLHWVRDQEAADQLRDQANRLTDVLEEMEGDTADKCAKLAEQVAAIQMAQMLHAVDPISGKYLIHENQELFFRLVRTLTHQTRERTFTKKIELEQRKYNDHVAKARREERQALAKRGENLQRGVTNEQLQMIEGAAGYVNHAPAQLSPIVNKYRQLMFRIRREAEERARLNDWEETETSRDPIVAAVERGEDPFNNRGNEATSNSSRQTNEADLVCSRRGDEADFAPVAPSSLNPTQSEETQPPAQTPLLNAPAIDVAQPEPPPSPSEPNLADGPPR